MSDSSGSGRRAPPKTDFQFITTVNSIERDDATRRRVRSHAKRSALLKKSGGPSSESVDGAGPSARAGGASEGADDGGGPGQTTTTPLPLRTIQSLRAGTSKFKINDASAATSSSSRSRKKEVQRHKQASQSLLSRRRDAATSAKTDRRGSEETAAESSSVTPARGTSYRQDADAPPNFEHLLPPDVNPATLELLRYYKAGFLTNSFALNPEGTWFEFVRCDPASLHAFLSTIAALHGAARGSSSTPSTPASGSSSSASTGSIVMPGPPPPQVPGIAFGTQDTGRVDYHRNLSVRHINQRLNTEGRTSERPVSDGVIVAVALLVNTECIMGSLDAATAHMSGLSKMVSLRGGLDALAHSSLLQRSVTWSDFAYSTAFSRPLAFPLVPSLCHTFPLSGQFLSATAMPSPKPWSLHIRDRGAIELAETLRTVTDMTDNFNNRAESEGWANKSSEQAMHRREIADAIYLLEYRLCEMEAQAGWGGGSPWDLGVSIGGMPTANILAAGDNVEIIQPIMRQALDGTMLSTERIAEQRSERDLSSALKYALHLFLHIAVRGQPPAAKRHRSMTERLMGVLWPLIGELGLLEDDPGRDAALEEAAVLGVAMEEAPGMTGHQQDSAISGASDLADGKVEKSPLDMHCAILVWILFVGACIRDPLTHRYPLLLERHHPHSVQPHERAPRCYRDFFIPPLRRLCIRQNIRILDSLEAVIRQVIWMEKLTWSKRQVGMLWPDLDVGITAMH